MCALFGGKRDVSLIRGLNRELMGDIITQQASIYKIKLQETPVNIYGEASKGKHFDGPFLFDCLISKDDQQYPVDVEGVKYKRGIKFSFFRDDLVEKNVLLEIGDVIMYENRYYGVESLIENQYFVGKNPEYPNEENPLNPDLEDFGSSISLICRTYYIPADKLRISPEQERF